MVTKTKNFKNGEYRLSPPTPFPTSVLTFRLITAGPYLKRRITVDQPTMAKQGYTSLFTFNDYTYIYMSNMKRMQYLLLSQNNPSLIQWVLSFTGNPARLQIIYHH